MIEITTSTGEIRVRDATDVRLFKMHLDTLAKLRAYGYSTPAASQRLWGTTVTFTYRGKP